MSDVMTGLLTLDEFLALAEGGDRQLELVRGEIREVAPSYEPAMTVTSNVTGLLFAHVRPRRLGRVYTDNGAFLLHEELRIVRSPDVAFVRADRLPGDGVRYGPVRLSPDLAVEVLSPSATASTLQEKVADYLETGTPLLWAVDPSTRTVTVYSADAPLLTLREGDVLTGGRVLPEFSCAVAELFEGVARG